MGDKLKPGVPEARDYEQEFREKSRNLIESVTEADRALAMYAVNCTLDAYLEAKQTQVVV